MIIKRHTTGLTDDPLSLGARVREWVKSAAIGFVIFLVVRTFLLQTFTIVSGSMENTLLIGDFLVLNKAAYGAMIPGTDVRLPGYDEPRRGDVVVFEGTADPIDIVKRLVGMPGDTIRMENARLYINGRVLAEPYALQSSSDADVSDPEMRWQLEHLVVPPDGPEYHPSNDNWGPLLIPAGHYFMLGDNRDNSRDSRYWGFVPHSHLKGRAEVVYFSWNRGGDGSRIRWSRLGDLIR